MIVSPTIDFRNMFSKWNVHFPIFIKSQSYCNLYDGGSVGVSSMVVAGGSVESGPDSGCFQNGGEMSVSVGTVATGSHIDWRLMTAPNVLPTSSSTTNKEETVASSRVSFCQPPEASTRFFRSVVPLRQQQNRHDMASYSKPLELGYFDIDIKSTCLASPAPTK